MRLKLSYINIAKLIGLLLPMITLRWGIGDYSFTLYMIVITIFSIYLLLIKKQKLLVSITDFYIYLFIFITFASILYSINMTYGISRFIKLGIVVGLYFIYKNAFINHPKLITIILKYSIYGMTIMLVYLAYIYLFKFNVNYIGLITDIPTRGSKNSLAFVVAIVSGFLVADFLSSLHNNGKNSIKVFFLALNVILSFAIQSRALFIIMFFYLGFLFFHIAGKKKFLKSILTIIGIFVILIINLPRNIKTSIYERFLTLNFLFDSEVVEENYSVGTRSDLLSKGITIFKENPLFGSGLGSFMEYGGVQTHISHNDYLLVLSEQGIVGFLIFFVLILNNIVIAYKNMKYQQNFTNTGLFLSMCGVSIYFLFINAYDNILFWTLLAFINAIALGYQKTNHEPIKMKKYI